MTRAAFAAGLPAPEVFGEVTLEGRFGIVLARFDGPTLLQLSRTGAMTSEQGARSSRPSPVRSQDVPAAGGTSLRDWLDRSLRGSGGRLPEHIATGILALIERLPPGDGLCHAIFTPAT